MKIAVLSKLNVLESTKAGKTHNLAHSIQPMRDLFEEAIVQNVILQSSYWKVIFGNNLFQQKKHFLKFALLVFLEKIQDVYLKHGREQS